MTTIQAALRRIPMAIFAAGVCLGYSWSALAASEQVEANKAVAQRYIEAPGHAGICGGRR